MPTCAIPLLNYMHHCNQYSIRQFISCAYLFHQLRATRGHLARNTRICLYNPYVIVHLKSQKRHIFRYGGSNILGVYQNNSDFFQVCEQILLFYYFGSVATHGHIAGKRKRPAAFALSPTRPGIGSTTWPVRHDTWLREGVLPTAQHFHFYVGPPVEQTDTPPAAGLENKNEGKIQLQHESQEIWCQMGLVDRVGAFCTSTTPTSTKFVLLILYYQYYHYTTSRYVHRTTSQEQKTGRSCFG